MSSSDKNTGEFAALVAASWPPAPDAPSEADWALSVLRSVPTGIFVTDTTGRCVYANDAWVALSGLGSEGSRGYGWIRSIHPSDVDQVRELWNDALDCEGPFHAEYRISVQGEPRWVVCEARPQLDEKGQLAGYVGSMTDLSAKREVERERENLQTQLRQADRMRAVGTLAGGIAHDFNNLLTAIVTGVQLALDEPGLDAGVYECLRAAHESAERGGELTRQLLTLGRRRRTSQHPTDVNAIVHRAAELLRRSLPSDITLELSLDGRLAPVEADTVQLLQVLLNLGINASDALPEGGLIELRTRARVDGSRHTTEIEVTDNGVGISSEYLDRVFDPFFTTKSPDSGNGLGLAMAFGFAEAAGGQICVESELGGGSRFILSLPADPSLVVKRQQESGPLPRGDETILLVDDDRPVLFSAREVLYRCGYRVLTARDGEEALDRHAALLPSIDLLVTDLVMPRLGGRQLLARMRELGCEPPALLMTGYAAPGLEALREEGFADALLKPFDPATLARSVRRCLDGAAASRAVVD
jgi:PAS domain S-box-containing protein